MLVNLLYSCCQIGRLAHLFASQKHMELFNSRLSHFNNDRADAAMNYPRELLKIASLENSAAAIEVVSQWPGYATTPLHNLSALASEIGVGNIYYKDESKRFHLKSFKALGGAYAVARQLQARILETTGEIAAIRDMLDNRFTDTVSDIVISCATDGNHGRSVAWGCQMFGCHCTIYIHRNVSEGRKQAMEALGAEVIRISGNYDDSVKLSNELLLKLLFCVL